MDAYCDEGQQADRSQSCVVLEIAALEIVHSVLGTICLILQILTVKLNSWDNLTGFLISRLLWSRALSSEAITKRVNP